MYPISRTSGHSLHAPQQDLPVKVKVNGLPEGWQAFATSQGTYYVSPEGQSQWEAPPLSKSSSKKSSRSDKNDRPPKSQSGKAGNNKVMRQAITPLYHGTSDGALQDIDAQGVHSRASRGVHDDDEMGIGLLNPEDRNFIFAYTDGANVSTMDAHVAIFTKAPENWEEDPYSLGVRSPQGTTPARDSRSSTATISITERRLSAGTIEKMNAFAGSEDGAQRLLDVFHQRFPGTRIAASAVPSAASSSTQPAPDPFAQFEDNEDDYPGMQW